jgi:adenylosuccinate synthase
MIQVVIGANYGDEGKGMIVDYLSRPDMLVVRFNGGAQAGHTVARPDGVSHEFHHFGAGTFRGAATLLSRFFVANPMIHREEAQELAALGLTPKVYIDPSALVSTPFDALINQAVERKRGDGRHGSCGVGINETVTRAERGYGLCVADLDLFKDAVRQVRRVAYEWMPRRAQELGVPVPAVYVDDYVWRFLEDAYFMLSSMERAKDEALIGEYDHVVFEGAQGLRLDEVRGAFPYVTRSRTGLTNVEALLRYAGKQNERVDVHYVTRTYVTRHGQGPLPFELPAHPWGWDGPETNHENDWQGRLRYAPLSSSDLRTTVMRDLGDCLLPGLHPSYAVTCLDQLGEYATTPEELLRQWFDGGGIPVGLVSAGPTREHVNRWTREEVVG